VIWTVTVNGSVNHNTLVQLAPGLPPQRFNSTLLSAGYPLYGYWGLREHYPSVMPRNGILAPSEVTLDTAPSYLGSSIPTQEASLASHIGFWRSTLSIGVLFDYRGGYKVYNATAQTAPTALREENIPYSPLWLQARAISSIEGSPFYPAGFFEDGTFVRFRELSLTYALPVSLAHLLRMTSLSLTGAVRNLALWTRFTGPDPEVSDGLGSSQRNPVTGAYEVNNDLRESGPGAVPLARYYVLRLNVGL
jgi:hypothetical protein